MIESTVLSSEFSPKQRSGIDIIDSSWGGVYRGGSYLVYGRETSGRGLLTLLFARTGAEEGESTLFISTERQKDLMIQAASLGFDLRKAYEHGIIRLIRVPPRRESSPPTDDEIARALSDLIRLVRHHNPTRLVVNDFLPFISFHSYERFRIELIRFLEKVDSLDSTLVLVMPEPANRQSHRMIDFMTMQVTGTIHIELSKDNGSGTSRKLTLLPHIGHIRREVVDYWDLAEVVDRPMERAAPFSGFTSSVDVSTPAAPARAVSTTAVQTPAAPEPVAPRVIAVPSREDTAGEESVRGTVPSQPPGIDATRSVESQDEPESQYEQEYRNYETFRLHLQRHFSLRDTGAEPFLLIAMRTETVEPGSRPRIDFTFLADTVQKRLSGNDELFVDREAERLIIFLANSRREDAQSLFAALKDDLQEGAPDTSDVFLHSVAAIVVPDGLPFETAEEFLTYALEEA